VVVVAAENKKLPLEAAVVLVDTVTLLLSL
jgi:hypothetical protein